MSDIVQRLRDSVTQARAIDRSELLNEAAGEIEKLRRRLRLADAALAGRVDEPIQKEKQAEVSFELTDAERKAICGAIALDHGRGGFQWGETLRGLLERMR